MNHLIGFKIYLLDLALHYISQQMIRNLFRNTTFLHHITVYNGDARTTEYFVLSIKMINIMCNTPIPEKLYLILDFILIPTYFY